MPNVNTLIKAAALVLWCAAFMLNLFGLLDESDPLTYYSWGLFLALVACLPTGWLFINAAIHRALAEHQIMLAEAVGMAVGDELTVRAESGAEEQHPAPRRIH